MSFPAPRTVSRSGEERRKGQRKQDGHGMGRGEGGGGGGGLPADFTRASPFRGESFSEEEGEGPWGVDEEDDVGEGRREPTRAERRLEGASGVGFVLKWIMAPMLIISLCFISSSSLPGNEAARKKVTSDSLPGTAAPRGKFAKRAKEAVHYRRLLSKTWELLVRKKTSRSTEILRARATDPKPHAL